MERKEVLEICTFLFLILISTIPLNVNGTDEKEIKVNILFDFGDGIIKWTEVELSTNFTAIYATDISCKKLNFKLDYSWSELGAFVNQIGNKVNQWPGAYWHFWIWNDGSENWILSDKGADKVNLSNNDTIAWSFVVDNEQFISPSPTATPKSKYPYICFRNNVYNTGKTDSPAPQTPNLLWKFNTRSYEADSTSTLYNGKLFINTWQGLFCLNEKDGNKIWNNLKVKGMSTPAIYDGKIFVGSNDGKIYCLNGTNGKIIWKSLLQKNPVYTGISSSPKIYENKIFIGTFNESGGNGSFYCLNAENGKIIWKYNTSSIHLSSSAIINGKVVIGLMGIFDQENLSWKPPYGLLCLNKDNGNLIWNFKTKGGVASSPAIFNSKIFFTSKDGFLYCVNEDGKEVWKNNIGGSISSPAISKNKIFVGTGEFGKDGKFYCFTINGKKIWEFVPNGGVQSSPVLAFNKIYFATNVLDGTIYCLNATNGKLIWKYLPEPEQYILSSPIIANGKLFICSDNGFIYCFMDLDENAKSEDGFITDINAFTIIGAITISTILFIKKK